MIKKDKVVVLVVLPFHNSTLSFFPKQYFKPLASNSQFLWMWVAIEFMTGEKQLSEKQKKKLADLLSRAVTNKTSPHPLDMRRAAVILYDVNGLGYSVVDGELEDVMNMSGQKYDDAVRRVLQDMSYTYEFLVDGLNDGFPRINEEDLEWVSNNLFFPLI